MRRLGFHACMHPYISKVKFQLSKLYVFIQFLNSCQYAFRCNQLGNALKAVMRLISMGNTRMMQSMLLAEITSAKT